MNRTKQTSGNFVQQHHCLPSPGKWSGRKNAPAIESFPQGPSHRTQVDGWVANGFARNMNCLAWGCRMLPSWPCIWHRFSPSKRVFQCPKDIRPAIGFSLWTSKFNALCSTSSSTVPWHSINTHSRDLGHTSFIYIRHGAHRNSLQHPYAGPFPVLERNEKYLVINHDGKIEKVTVDPLKTAYLSLVEPLFHPTAASQLQFLQHVDHTLGYHSQILQYLFVHKADERSVHETDWTCKQDDHLNWLAGGGGGGGACSVTILCKGILVRLVCFPVKSIRAISFCLERFCFVAPYEAATAPITFELSRRNEKHVALPYSQQWHTNNPRGQN